MSESQIEFFKKQSKKLFKNWKSRNQIGIVANFSNLFSYFNIEISDFCLTKAQHIVAKIVGFNKWEELIKASDDELEFSKQLFIYCKTDVYKIEKWNLYSVRFGNFIGLNLDEKLRTLNFFFTGIERFERQQIEEENKLNEQGKDIPIRILRLEEKNIAINLALKDFSYSSDTMVECIYCRDIFNIFESTVIQKTSLDRPRIMCRNYPVCNGKFYSLIPMTQTIENKQQENLYKRLSLVIDFAELIKENYGISVKLFTTDEIWDFLEKTKLSNFIERTRESSRAESHQFVPTGYFSNGLSLHKFIFELITGVKIEKSRLEKNINDIKNKQLEFED